MTMVGPCACGKFVRFPSDIPLISSGVRHALRGAITTCEHEWLMDIAEAVLLFHRGGEWTIEDQTHWKALTGYDEATTKSLCNALRRALGR